MPPPNPVVEGHLLLPFSGFGDIPIKYRARTWAVGRIADCRKAGLEKEWGAVVLCKLVAAFMQKKIPSNEIWWIEEKPKVQRRERAKKKSAQQPAAREPVISHLAIYQLANPLY